MKVILLEDEVIKEVKDGYARNYLFPKKLAIIATPEAILKTGKRCQDKADEVAEAEKSARELAGKINSVAITIKAEAGEKDTLFGSVGGKEIADALSEQQGIEIDRKNIIISNPIKTLGEFTAQVRLFHGISADLKIIVEKQ